MDGSGRHIPKMENGETMKALSIRQPWAWAILHGKPVENRNWETKFRGPIFIHASKAFDNAGYEWLWQHRSLLEAEILHPHDFPKGGIVGKTEIVDCVTDYPSQFFFGPFGFVLKNTVETRFFECRGQLSFFDAPAEVLAQLNQTHDVATTQKYLESFKCGVCFCGKKKLPRRSFCPKCFYQIPPDMKTALYKPFGQGYEQAYERALTYLNKFGE